MLPRMKKLLAALLLSFAASSTATADCPIVNRVITYQNGTCFSGYYEDCNGRIAGYFAFCI